MTDETKGAQAPTPGPLSGDDWDAIRAHPCYGEHQPGCDCVIPDQSLAPTAPVEASGSEREGPEPGWLRRSLDRAKVEAEALRLAQTDPQGVIDAVAALRHQPSGETREAVARIIDPEMWERRARRLDQGYALNDNAYVGGSLTKADAILALLSARPLALGGQHSGGESFTVDELAQEIRRVDGNHDLGAGALAEALTPFLLNKLVAYANHTTPARAEGEGAAGEPVEDLWQELCERDDRTSPDEYPEMCLVTRDELSDFINRARTPARTPARAEALDEGAEMTRLLKLADSALANVTAFEDDARYIMGNTNYAITENARSEIRSFLLAQSAKTSVRPKALEILERLLDHSGARGSFDAMKHGDAVKDAEELLRSARSPGHTDLMVTPESIDAYMRVNPMEAQDEGAAGEKNLGWFAGFARKHGHHAQADWLDNYVRAHPSPPPAADEVEKLEAERDAWKLRGDNHWETLRSIREFAREGDYERIIQWVNDAGSGYVESAEQTLGQMTDRALKAEEALNPPPAADEDRVSLRISPDDLAIVERVFLPANPNKLRSAHPDTVKAAHAFKNATAEALAALKMEGK